ncbi:uncharacterized protein LOC143066276 [Mytilus galloprovincialis]|uniref:uncharacterized protein LOC143066276 n=1 Tax=Mytilus galloprovincialis TaxID=29158 RepID=UPI003F7C90E9
MENWMKTQLAQVVHELRGDINTGNINLQRIISELKDEMENGMKTQLAQVVHELKGDINTGNINLQRTISELKNANKDHISHETVYESADKRSDEKDVKQNVNEKKDSEHGNLNGGKKLETLETSLNMIHEIGGEVNSEIKGQIYHRTVNESVVKRSDDRQIENDKKYNEYGNLTDDKNEGAPKTLSLTQLTKMAGELRGKTKSEHMQISRMRTELMDENDYYGNENELQEMEIELEELGLTPTASSVIAKLCLDPTNWSPISPRQNSHSHQIIPEKRKLKRRNSTEVIKDIKIPKFNESTIKTEKTET